jgi:hypothetical protein
MAKGTLFLPIFCTIVALAVSACGKSASEDNLSPQELAQRDITAMSSVDSGGADRVDAKYNGIFSAIFGGTSGAQISQYFQARVHHIVDTKRIVLSPSRFENENWLKSPAPAAPQPAPDADTGTGGSKKYQTGALNIGAVLWLEGMVNQVSVSYQPQDGDAVQIDSTRAGIVELGDGYIGTAKTTDGGTIKVPAQYRQAILLHEARHSDCTGGITEAQLKTLRGLKDTNEYEQTFDTMPCGHLHRICTQGDLAGMAACDSEAWGAYTVGSIYALASLAGANDKQSIAIFKSQFADQIARVHVDLDALLNGDLGKPDMSSQGYVAAPAAHAAPAAPAVQ